MPAEVLCNCGPQLLGKTCDARFRSHPWLCCSSSSNFPYHHDPVLPFTLLALHWSKSFDFRERCWSEKGAGLRCEERAVGGWWPCGPSDAHLQADASKGTEGWLCTSQGSAPFSVGKKKKDVERDKNNIFKECPQKSSGLVMAVLCKYFCAWFSRHAWEVLRREI